MTNPRSWRRRRRVRRPSSRARARRRTTTGPGVHDPRPDLAKRSTSAAERAQRPRMRLLGSRQNSGQTAAGISLRLPPSDAKPRGTGRSGQGRRVTAEAVSRPFAHVTGDERDQAGMGRDPRGDGGATCKTAGYAYTGSNPVPATTSELRNYTDVTRSRQGPFYQPSTSFYQPTGLALLMGRTDPQSAWPGGVGSGGAGGCRFYWPACRRRRGATAPRSRWRAPWPPPSPRPASGAADGDARRPRRLARRPGTPGWHAPAAPGSHAGSAAPGRG
jgi:hypothetical protein